MPLDAAVAELDPVDGDVDDDRDDVADVVVAPWADVVAAAADPPVAASTAPVTPAPSPPAMIAVMASRRSRAPLETIKLLLSWQAVGGSPSQEAACVTALARDRTRLLHAV